MYCKSVFFCVGICSMGMGMSGYGSPLKSIRSIIAARSLPVTTSFEDPLIASGCTSVCRITPSINTCGIPGNVTSNTTRKTGSGELPASRKNVSRIPLSDNVNVNWKPLRPVALSVTSTDTSASTSGLGAGSGSIGPTSNVRYSGLTIACSRGNARDQGNYNRPARLRRQIIRLKRSVRIRNHPEKNRVADKARRQVVQPVANHHAVVLRLRVHTRLRNDAPRQISHLRPIRQRRLLYRKSVVAAVGIRRRSRSRSRLHHRRQRVIHPALLVPNLVSS